MKRGLLLVSMLLVVVLSCGRAFSEEPAAGKRNGRAAKFKEYERFAGDPNAARRYEQVMQQRHRTAEQGRTERERKLRAKAIERLKARQEASKLREKARGGGEGAAAEGQDRTQQMHALEKQLAQERQKHQRRRARLNRIRELALEEGKADVVAKVDKLLGKENRRHERKRLSMDKRLDMLERIAEQRKKMAEPAERPMPKGPSKPGTRRPRPARAGKGGAEETVGDDKGAAEEAPK